MCVVLDMLKANIEITTLRWKVSLLEKELARLDEKLALIPPPHFVAELSSAQVKTKIQAIFPDIPILETADRRYKITTVAEMNRFLARDDTDKMKWQRDAPDCDDVTRRLLGNLTIPGWWSMLKGDVWIWNKPENPTWGHSIMITLLCPNENDLDPRVFFVEGQTDVVELATEMFEDIYVYLIKI